MKYLKFFILIIALIISSTAVADIAFPRKISKQKPISVELQSEYFHSKANYLELGRYVDLPDKNSFSFANSRVTLGYSPWSWLYLETFGSAVFWSQSVTNNFVRSGAGFTDIGLGLEFAKKYKDLTAQWEVQAAYSFETTPSLDTNGIIFSDSAHWAQTSLWVSYEYKKIMYVFSNVGFKYRTAGLAGLSYYSMGGVFQSSFAELGFSTNLMFPLIVTDSYYQTPDKRLAILKRVNGGSYKFYSLHPIRLSFTTWMQWKLPSVDLKVYFNLDSYGQNTARGLTAGLESRYTFNTNSTRRKNNRKIKKYKKSFFKSIKQKFYKNEDDDNDEDDNNENEYDEYNENNDEDEGEDEGAYVTEELQQELKSLRN